MERIETTELSSLSRIAQFRLKTCDSHMAIANSELATLIRDMRPRLNPGLYAFCLVPDDDLLNHSRVIASFREVEGMTVIVPESVARELGWKCHFRAGWITLDVRSDLNAVGFTAAIATELARAGISCNVIAAIHPPRSSVRAARSCRRVD